MTIFAPKAWFPPLTTGVSISGLPSFIPYTFVVKTDLQGIFEASIEADHYCDLSSALSQTVITYYSSPSIEDEVTPPNQRGAKFLRQLGECFLLRSHGKALASLSAKRADLKSFLVECCDAEGCRVHYWLRTDLQIYHGCLSFPEGVFLVDTQQVSSVSNELIDFPNATCILSIEAQNQRPGAVAAAIKPIRVHSENLDDLNLKDRLQLLPLVQQAEQNQSTSSLQLHFLSEKKVFRLESSPVNYSHRQRSAVVEELIGQEVSSNRRHFDAIIPPSFGSLSELPSAADLAQIYPGSLGGCLNYLLVMSPRSGSTALTELLARKGIGVPSELTIPYCYNLLCALENGPTNSSYIDYVLSLFRDRSTSISGLQIDVDRLRDTWRAVLDERVNKYIFYFRRSLTNQAISMSLAVCHGLWFGYDSNLYNQSLRVLTFDQFYSQLLRLIGMQVYSLDYYLAKIDASIIITNEQHLRSPDALYSAVWPHLGLGFAGDLSLIEDVTTKSVECMPTREVSGRNSELLEAKRSAFIQQLGLPRLEDLITSATDSRHLLTPDLISLFTSIFHL